MLFDTKKSALVRLSDCIKLGIRGIVCGGSRIGLYLYVSSNLPPIDVLYRYDDERVYVESIKARPQLDPTKWKNLWHYRKLLRTFYI